MEGNRADAVSQGIVAPDFPVAVFEDKNRRFRVNDFNADAATPGFLGNRGGIYGFHGGMMAFWLSGVKRAKST
jgi:hypothetical protein